MESQLRRFQSNRSKSGSQIITKKTLSLRNRVANVVDGLLPDDEEENIGKIFSQHKNKGRDKATFSDCFSLVKNGKDQVDSPH